MGFVRLALGCAAAVLVHGASIAATINVQFGATGQVFGDTPNYTGAAVIGDANDQWNFVGGTFGGPWGRTISSQPLSDVDGAATGATLSLTTPDAFINLETLGSFFSATAYADLMNSFVFADGNRLGLGQAADGPGEITIGGLSAGGRYQLILLSSGDVIGRTTRFDLGGGIKLAANSGADTFIEGDNYVVYEAIADGAGELSFMFDAAVNEANLNGLQLTSLSVPEPGTWALVILGFGGVGAALRRRCATTGLA